MPPPISTSDSADRRTAPCQPVTGSCCGAAVPVPVPVPAPVPAPVPVVPPVPDGDDGLRLAEVGSTCAGDVDDDGDVEDDGTVGDAVG